MNRRIFVFLAVALLGLASAIETRLAVFAFLLVVIALAAQTRLEHPRKRVVFIALSVGLAGTAVGLYRFILHEALPGIIEAHGRASGGRAVSFLREISFAQDAMRRYAFIDPDRDGIGSAGSLAELSGAPSSRVPSGLKEPPLAPRYAPRLPSREGPLTEESGYLYLVCLPNSDGTFSALSGPRVDDESAERRFIAYAWPADDKQATWTSYFIDEHENIGESPNLVEGRPRLLGSGRPPGCDDALGPEGAARYTPWRGKKPRADLPGDR